MSEHDKIKAAIDAAEELSSSGHQPAEAEHEDDDPGEVPIEGVEIDFDLIPEPVPDHDLFFRLQGNNSPHHPRLGPAAVWQVRP